MEWIDHLGKGNGSVHWISDETGHKVLGYRLSDYGNTNKVYVLRIWNDGEKEHLKGVAVSVIKGKDNGDSVGPGKFALKRTEDLDDASVSLPPEFAPEEKGDMIDIEVECISPTGKPLLLRTRLRAKSVWHYPSI